MFHELQSELRMMAVDPSDRSAAMVHFKYKTFSEEVCRPVAFVGSKNFMMPY